MRSKPSSLLLKLLLISGPRQWFPVQGFVANPIVGTPPNQRFPFRSSPCRSQHGRRLMINRPSRPPLKFLTGKARCKNYMSSASRDDAAWGVVKHIVMPLLCAASLLGGPDILRISEEVALATRLTVRPPSAQALSDEQVIASRSSLTNSVFQCYPRCWDDRWSCNSA